MQNTKINKTALVLLSGGQDSVTCLGWALANFNSVEAISFRYQQRHVVEVAAAADICARHNIPHKVVDLGSLLSNLVRSALTDADAPKGAVSEPHPDKPGLPASFVPGRNALFLTLAHAWAQTILCDVIVTGVCETDYSGYPDCREVFIGSLMHSLNLGYQTSIIIRTPLMHVDKGTTFLQAAVDGFLGEVLAYSRTCYNGSDARHEWGQGCGECPACALRIKGWEQFKAVYPQHAAAGLAEADKLLGLALPKKDPSVKKVKGGAK